MLLLTVAGAWPEVQPVEPSSTGRTATVQAEAQAWVSEIKYITHKLDDLRAEHEMKASPDWKPDKTRSDCQACGVRTLLCLTRWELGAAG